MAVELIRRGNEPRFPKLRTEQVKAALRGRFHQPEWALFFEVADGTGAAQRRWADAVAMNMFNSRGLAVHGFEIKVSRSDWRRELENPAKADSIAGFCDHWSIAAPKGMIDVDELPPTWGLFEVDADLAIVQKKAPARLDAIPMTKSFVAAFLRSAAKVDERVVTEAINRARLQWEESVEQRVRERTSRIHSRGADALAFMESFKESTGIDLTSYKWDAEKLAKVVALANSGALDRWGGIGQMVDNIESTLKLAKSLQLVLDAKPQP